MSKPSESTLPLTDDDGEVRELSTADLRHFRPASKVLPPELLALLPKRGRGPQVLPVKVPVKIRLDADVLAALKASGDGWQTRINTALRALLLPG
jgi:uncharacterized protein (DUF4415 family)